MLTNLWNMSYSLIGGRFWLLFTGKVSQEINQIVVIEKCGKIGC